MEDQDTAVQAVPDVTHEDSPSQNETVEVQQDQSPDAQPEQESGQSEVSEEEKPRDDRRTKRIKDLVGKLKGREEPEQRVTSLDDIFGNVGKTQEPTPFVTPEDYQEGLDPQKLEERFSQRLATERDNLKKEVFAELEFKHAVKAHEKDVTETAKLLEKEPDAVISDIVDRYNALNYQIDPRTGTKYFTGAKKMSEIYKEAMAVIEAKISRSQAEVQVNLRNTAEQSAIRSSAPAQSGSDGTEEQTYFERAIKSGSDEDFAKALKARLFASQR